MFNGSNCDRKSQLSGILTEPLNPRDIELGDHLPAWSVSSGSTNTCYSLNDKSGPSNKIILNLLSLTRDLSSA